MSNINWNQQFIFTDISLCVNIYMNEIAINENKRP